MAMSEENICFILMQSFVFFHEHAKTIDSTWRHVKAFLNPYNRKGEYILHLAQYMFAARCRNENVDQFTKFLLTRSGASVLLLTTMVPRDSLKPHIHYYVRRRLSQFSVRLNNHG